MRLLIILTTALALALPISAQAKSGGSKTPSGAKTPSVSATGGSSAGKASPTLAKQAAKGRHFDKVILH